LIRCLILVCHLGIGLAIRGAEEWGRRNGITPKEARKKFHEMKGGNRGLPGSKANDSCGVNPDTGEIIDSNGDDIGDLND
jgi:hypothetical protein